MSETTTPVGGTIGAAPETKDPFRETIAVAVGPNVDGPSDMVRLAHTLPDPAVVDNPEAPDSPES